MYKRTINGHAFSARTIRAMNERRQKELGVLWIYAILVSACSFTEIQSRLPSDTVTVLLHRPASDRLHITAVAARKDSGSRSIHNWGHYQTQWCSAYAEKGPNTTLASASIETASMELKLGNSDSRIGKIQGRKRAIGILKVPSRTTRCESFNPSSTRNQATRCNWGLDVA